MKKKYSVLFLVLIITQHVSLAQRDSLSGTSPSLGLTIAPKLSLPTSSKIPRKTLATAVGEIGVDTQLFSNVSLMFTSLFLYDLSSAKLSNNRESRYYSMGLKVGILFDLKS